MEADLPEPILLQEHREVAADVVRVHERSILVDVDVLIRLVVVFRPVEPLPVLPFQFHLEEEVLDRGEKRQSPHARGGLGGVPGDELRLPVDHVLGHRVPDREGLVLEVDRRPFEPDDLLAPQSVVGRHDDRELKFGPLHLLKELLGLIDVVIVADKPLHLGQGDLPARVAFNDVALEGEIDALADQRMEMADRARADVLALLAVERLDVLGRDALEPDPLPVEPRGDHPVRLVIVARVGAQGDRRPHLGRPPLHVVAEKHVWRHPVLAVVIARREVAVLPGLRLHRLQPHRDQRGVRLLDVPRVEDLLEVGQRLLRLAGVPVGADLEADALEVPIPRAVVPAHHRVVFAALLLQIALSHVALPLGFAQPPAPNAAR